MGMPKSMGYSLTAMKTVQAEKLLSFDIHNALDKEGKSPLFCNFLLQDDKKYHKKHDRKECTSKKIKASGCFTRDLIGPKILFLLSFRDGFYNHLRFAYEAFISDVESHY